MSTPTCSLGRPRRSGLMLTAAATFCATVPRRWASLRMLLREVKTLRVVARVMPSACSWSTKACTVGVFSRPSFSRPILQRDVQGDVLAVLRLRAALALVLLDRLQPVGARLGDGDRGQFRRVHAGGDVDADAVGRGLRFLLALERLDVALAVLVGIVDKPLWPHPCGCAIAACELTCPIL